jgi:uncharacterized membrane protein YbhN (UPF0104 family)
LIGIVLLAACAGYLLLGQIQRTPFRLFSLSLSPVALRLGLLQIIAASVNWIAVGSVLYVLLPAELQLSYFTVLSLFVVAQGAGWLSQIPGGLGVLESTFLLMISRLVPAGALVQISGSLFAFRAVYSLLPFVAMTLLHTCLFARRRIAIMLHKIQ